MTPPLGFGEMIGENLDRFENHDLDPHAERGDLDHLHLGNHIDALEMLLSEEGEIELLFGWFLLGGCRMSQQGGGKQSR